MSDWNDYDGGASDPSMDPREWGEDEPPEDPMDSPPEDHGSDRHGYVELTYDGPVRWPVSIPSHTLLESLRCHDCLPNLFLRWDGKRWHSTIAHDDGCPTLAAIEAQ